jgi:hypothetical protein
MKIGIKGPGAMYLSNVGSAMNAVDASVNVDAPWFSEVKYIYLCICMYSVHRSSDI